MQEGPAEADGARPRRAAGVAVVRMDAGKQDVEAERPFRRKAVQRTQRLAIIRQPLRAELEGNHPSGLLSAPKPHLGRQGSGGPLGGLQRLPRPQA
jgi:hypothetical protein